MRSACIIVLIETNKPATCLIEIFHK